MIITFIDDILKNGWYYLAIVILVVLAIVLVISFVIVSKKDQKYRAALEEQSNSVRIFIVDVPNDHVKFFNVMTLSHVSECSLGQFYQHFPVSQQRKVINWINALAEPGTDCPDYLETDISDSQTKKRYFSLLQVTSVDRERGVIHIQSYLMKYLVASNKGNENHYGLSTVKEFDAAISGNNRKKGFSACFRFLYKKVQDKEKDIDPLLFNQMKNALFPFVSGRRYLLQCSGNDLLFADLRTSEKAKILYLVRACLNSINRYLILNGKSSVLDVRVGVVEHGVLQGDSSAIIDATKATASLAFEDNSSVLFYEKGRRVKNTLAESAYRTEVERIIEEKRIHYYFRPIYSVDKEKVTGYFAKSSPYDAYFDSMDELKDYAHRTEDDKALFATIAKDTLHIFLNENQDDKCNLFFPVRMDERSHLLVTFGKLARAKSAHMVFLFDEVDVLSSLNGADADSIIELMRLIKGKGYEVGLSMRSGELKLPPRTYTAFDYFVVGFGFAGSASEQDTRIRSQLHALVEKLLKYHKTIIATDIEGWASIDLIISSGVRFISSESFAPFDVMISPPSPKSIKRIRDINR